MVEKQQPVSFMLNALGEWQGKRTVYNGGTGVVPQARGQRLTQQMYSYILPKLQEEGVEQCLLEVIQENQRALRIYQSLGFEIMRAFRCFRQAKEALVWHTHVAHEVVYTPVAHPDWGVYRMFWEVEPSWQHHMAAMDRSHAYVHIIEAKVQDTCVGYGVVFSMTGAIAQLAVAPAWRGKGIGQGLVQQLMRVVTAPALSVINVEEQAHSLVQFLQGRKMEEVLGQYEMIRPM